MLVPRQRTGYHFPGRQKDKWWIKNSICLGGVGAWNALMLSGNTISCFPQSDRLLSLFKTCLPDTGAWQVIAGSSGSKQIYSHIAMSRLILPDLGSHAGLGLASTLEGGIRNGIQLKRQLVQHTYPSSRKQLFLCGPNGFMRISYLVK